MRDFYSSDNTSRKKLYACIQLQYKYDEQFHVKQEGKQVSKSHSMMIDMLLLQRGYYGLPNEIDDDDGL